MSFVGWLAGVSTMPTIDLRLCKVGVLDAHAETTALSLKTVLDGACLGTLLLGEEGSGTDLPLEEGLCFKAGTALFFEQECEHSSDVWEVSGLLGEQKGVRGIDPD